MSVDQFDKAAADAPAKLCVMIVDDEDQKRMLLARFLRRAHPGTVIVDCANGREAMEKFDAQPIDVVITDNRMEPVGGLELTRWIRERAPSVPVVMVTGHPDLEQEARKAGAARLIDFVRYAEIGEIVTEVLRERGVG